MMTTKPGDQFATMNNNNNNNRDGKGSGAATKSAGGSRQKLIFIPPLSNPKDSKRPQIRKMVAKHAMQNRPKAPLTTVPPPMDGPTTTTTITTSNSNSNHSQQVPQRPRNPPVAIPPLSTPPFARPNHARTNQADHPVPAPLGVLSKTRDYYALDLPDTSQKTHRTRERPDQPTPFDRMYIDPGSSTSPTSDSSPCSDEDRQARSPSEASNLIGDGIVGDLEDELDLDFAMVPSSDSESPETDYLINPLDILASSRNPFDCLPIACTPHTKDLIDFYLTGSYLSPALTQGNMRMPDRVKNYRQNMWFPVAANSKILMHALMAYIETTPGLPIPSQTSVYLWENVQEAYTGMRRKLENEKSQIDDGICMAVVLLMLTAQRTGDITTFRRHATGLQILLKARASAFKRDKLLRYRSESKWQGLAVAISGPPDPDPCKYCQDSHLRPSGSRSPSPVKDEDLSEELIVPERSALHQHIQNNIDPNIPISLRGAGFYDLINRGYLAVRTTNFVEEALIMVELAEHTRHDSLSAAVASTHAWIDEQPNSMPPLDTACQYAIRLCLYLSNWLERGHGCAIVRRMAMAMYRSLRHPLVDIDRLLAEYPLVLLWLCLIAGPMTEMPEAEQWFSCLLARARDATENYQYMGFDQAIDRLGYLFVWINTMTPGARRFWMDNSWDVGTAASFMATLP